MPVLALKDYQFSPADTQDKFHGGQLLFVGWDDHLMFCAPLAYCVPPDTRFGDLCEKTLATSYGYHPDWKMVDFTQVTWLKPCRTRGQAQGRTAFSNARSQGAGRFLFLIRRPHESRTDY